MVALSGGFHGRPLGTLLATGNPDKHLPFEPLGDWVTHVPHDDAAALDAAVGPRTSAVLVEVVQGEGGVRPVPADVLRAARAACDRVGALLIVDEVQTGLGRLGSWYGWQTALDGSPVQPQSASPLANLDALTVSSVTGSQINVSANVTPPTGGGFEVRRRDWSFGPGTNSDLVLRSTVPNFIIPREAVMEQYYIRMYDGSTPPNYSRFSAAVFVNLPL